MSINCSGYAGFGSSVVAPGSVPPVPAAPSSVVTSDGDVTAGSAAVVTPERWRMHSYLLIIVDIKYQGWGQLHYNVIYYYYYYLGFPLLQLLLLLLV